MEEVKQAIISLQSFRSLEKAFFLFIFLTFLVRSNSSLVISHAVRTPLVTQSTKKYFERKSRFNSSWLSV